MKCWDISCHLFRHFNFYLVNKNVIKVVNSQRKFICPCQRGIWGQTLLWELVSLQWRHNGRDGVSDHQPYDCSLNCIFKEQIKENFQSSASLASVREIHRWPVNSPRKGPVTRKMFPFDDVIMWMENIFGSPNTRHLPGGIVRVWVKTWSCLRCMLIIKTFEVKANLTKWCPTLWSVLSLYWKDRAISCYGMTSAGATMTQVRSSHVCAVSA